MKFFWVKSKLFYSAAGHFVLFKTSRTADSKKKTQKQKNNPLPKQTKKHECTYAAARDGGVYLILSFLQCPSPICWVKLSKIECSYYFWSFIIYNIQLYSQI